MTAPSEPPTAPHANTRTRRVELVQAAREHRLELGEISMDDHLDELWALVADAARIQRALAERVDLARAKGATWREIGNATGTSAQAAYQRWTPAAKERDRSRKAKVRERAHQIEAIPSVERTSTPPNAQD